MGARPSSPGGDPGIRDPRQRAGRLPCGQQLVRPPRSQDRGSAATGLFSSWGPGKVGPAPRIPARAPPLPVRCQGWLGVARPGAGRSPLDGDLIVPAVHGHRRLWHRRPLASWSLHLPGERPGLQASFRSPELLPELGAGGERKRERPRACVHVCISLHSLSTNFVVLFFYDFIYWRERTCEQGEEPRVREKQTQSPMQGSSHDPEIMT